MLEAIFTSGVDEIEVNGLTQWDRGRTLNISVPEGLPSLYQAHFAFRGGSKALSVSVVDNAAVQIPDEILTQPRDVVAYVYLIDSDGGGMTVKTIHLPLTPRAKPVDYEDLPPSEQAQIDAMLASINTKVETAAADAQRAQRAAEDSALSATNSETAAKAAQTAAETAVRNANTAISTAQTGAAEAIASANEAIDAANEALAGVEEYNNQVATTQTIYPLIPVSWTYDTALGLYVQTVGVSGIGESDNPLADIVLGSDAAANETYEAAWLCIYRITTANDSITLYATSAPAVAFTIQLKVVR